MAVQLVGKGDDTVDLTMMAAGDKNEASRIERAITVLAAEGAQAPQTGATM